MSLLITLGAQAKSLPGFPYKNFNYALNQTTWVYKMNALGYVMGGSGFYLHTPKNHVILITNAHVCGAFNRSMLVQNLDGTTHEFKIIKRNRDFDLCALQPVNEGPGHYGLTLSAKMPECFQSVFAAGHPALGPIKLTYTQLCDRVFMDEVIGGNSGSPVLDTYSLEVIGVVFARHINKPLGFIVPLNELTTFVKDM